MTACNGWQYGPPSPVRSEMPPFYNTQRMNRHNGPEDQSMADRCMSGSEPDFIGFRRIVQGPDSIAIGVDTGQGQGFQRIVYLSGNHPPNDIRRLFKTCRIIGRRFRLAHIFFGPKIIETSTFRANPREVEGAPESGPDDEILIRRDNVFGTAEEDARRRDFTINGLFYDLEAGQVIDYVDGGTGIDTSENKDQNDVLTSVEVQL